jgi:Tfp pilus assembly protein PilX
MSHPKSSGYQESGGIAILMALILLSIAAVVTVSLSRSAIREALITSNESTGRKAYEMADSGIDYLITWSNTPYVTAPSPTAEMIATQYQTLLNAIDPSNNTFTGMDPDGTIKVTMLASNIGGDLTPGTTGYLQTNSVVQPAFDLELRYLGHPFATQKSKGPAFFIARSTGRANIANTGQSFISRREALVY